MWTVANSVQDLNALPPDALEWLSICANSLMYPKLLKPLMTSKFFSVAFLDLSKISSLSDNDIRYLVNLPILKYLDISYSDMTAKGIRYLLKHSKLKNTLKALKMVRMSHFHDSWIKLISCFRNITLLDLFDNQLSLDTIVKVVDPDQCLMKNLTMIRLPKNISNYLIDKHVLQEEWDKAQPSSFKRKKTSTPVAKMIAYLKHVLGKGFIGSTFHDKDQLRRLLHTRACEEKLYDLMFL